MNISNRIGAESVKTSGRVRMAVFGVLGLNAFGLVALLIQGCRQEPAASKEELANTNPPASSQVTNLALAATTNVVVPPSNTTAAAVATNAPVSAPPLNVSYTIVAGDTLCGVARTLHTTVQALLEANPGIEPTKLQIGLRIRLPEVAKAIATKAEEQTSRSDGNGERIYTVKSGDYLLKVAGQFGTTVGAIREANGLKTDRIEVGQKLKIPQNNAGAQPLEPREASLLNGEKSV